MMKIQFSRCDSSKKSLMIWACADEVCIFALYFSGWNFISNVSG